MSADILLAEYEDIVAHTVQHLFAHNQAQLPDWSSICIFTPTSNLSANFRKAILQALPQQHRAMIPPYIGTLRQWISEHIPLPDAATQVLSDQARQLLFVDALSAHPSLFKEENKWQVSTALLNLFDELALNKINVLEQSTEAWSETLESAYDCATTNPHLQQEARLVYTLWHAWQQQLHDDKLLDGTGAYIARLKQADILLNSDRHCYLIEPDQLTACEQRALAPADEQNRCTVIAYTDVIDTPAQPAPGASTAAFIKAAFDFSSAPLQQRADAFKQTGLTGTRPFSIFYSGDAESEARAIDLQIRLWLLQGKQAVGIVSEDRRLSRRVRALLERASVDMQDMAGWSLATTSAAAVLERWLECIEEDFDYRPMLDLLKSHFFISGLEHEQQLETVYRLENDIILHENISHGLARYRKHLGYRLHRLQHWPDSTYDNSVRILEQLQMASYALRRLYRSNKKSPLDTFIDALTASLQQLGIMTSFSDDAAGMQILNALEEMRNGLFHCNPKMHWHDFRTWLGMTLEQQLFSPQTRSATVRLMGMAQAQCQHFDALVIAAADKQHLPGKPDASPFFNQSVRSSLGLSDWQQQRELKLSQFRRLLLSADDILITCKHEENGEPVPLSPWIEALQTFHGLTHRGALNNTALQQLLQHDTSVFICDTEQLPGIPEQPRPSMPVDAIPLSMSASSHQRLIDCPYKYFATDGMRLKPPDEIREELQKSDYGERVHKILNAFHSPVKGLPQPFTARLTEENREAAIDHLAGISAVAFKQDTEDNTLHRSWLHRWMQHVPAYIDWQIRQQQQWTVNRTEEHCEARLNESTLTLHGRLDRIDIDNDVGTHQSIIDYKTGSMASQADVDCGEDVQLASYALLAKDVSSVMYLSLDESDGSVKTRASLRGENLQSLTHAIRQRLLTVLSMQQKGKPLPAWGDERTCSYCDFIGLCRKKVWDNGD
ncbi:MAG: PD-(D/E)XK nuclease family protein [Gammaproteobacteria bacterium]